MGIYVQQTPSNFTVNLGGGVFAGVTGNFNVNCTGILNNNLATLSIDTFQHLSGAVPAPIVFQLPGAFQSSHSVNKLIEVIIDSNTRAIGSINISPTGLCTITIFPNTNFSAGTICGFPSIDITYPVKSIPQ